jgi:hypothetical protein
MSWAKVVKMFTPRDCKWSTRKRQSKPRYPDEALNFRPTQKSQKVFTPRRSEMTDECARLARLWIGPHKGNVSGDRSTAGDMSTRQFVVEDSLKGSAVQQGVDSSRKEPHRIAIRLRAYGSGRTAG